MHVEELVNGVMEGKIVLPDFQIDFVWDPDRVRELAVSVLGDYFIGSILILNDIKDKCPFELRLIYGVKEVNKTAEVQPFVQVLLDGQQRATALFYALKQPDKPLKYRKNPYRFYVDLEQALDKKWDTAVISVNKSDKKGFDKLQSEPNVIPLNSLLDIGGLAEKFTGHPKLNKIIKLADDFRLRPIHMVELPTGTDLEKIVETFERANRFGVPLTTFELLTARLRKYEINLPDLWNKAQHRYEVVEFIDPEVILRVITSQRGKGTKRKALLELEPAHFKEDWSHACEMLNIAYKRLTHPKQGYGVLGFQKWLPYTTMLVPLATIIGFLKSNNLVSPKNDNKIDRWYWTSVFSNRYEEGATTKQETDFNALKEWVLDDDKVPDFIQEFEPNAVDLTVEKQNAATYRGVINLIVLEGARDFETGRPPQFDEEHIQDDHIFPKSIYNEHRILNRTLLTTNAKKANAKPSIYFKNLLKKHGEDALKRILESHIIPGESLEFLLADNVRDFTKARRKALVKKIKQKVKSKS